MACSGLRRLKTVGLHLTGEVLRIWRGSVTDGNSAIFPEADATHMDLLSGANVVRVSAFAHEVDVY